MILRACEARFLPDKRDNLGQNRPIAGHARDAASIAEIPADIGRTLNVDIDSSISMELKSPS
jgi:hypothetical protein